MPNLYSLQLGQIFPSERLLGEGRREADKIRLAVEWEGEKEAGKEEMLWRLSGKTTSK